MAKLLPMPAKSRGVRLTFLSYAIGKCSRREVRMVLSDNLFNLFIVAKRVSVQRWVLPNFGS